MWENRLVLGRRKQTDKADRVDAERVQKVRQA